MYILRQIKVRVNITRKTEKKQKKSTHNYVKKIIIKKDSVPLTNVEHIKIKIVKSRSNSIPPINLKTWKYYNLPT